MGKDAYSPWFLGKVGKEADARRSYTDRLNIGKQWRPMKHLDIDRQHDSVWIVGWSPDWNNPLCLKWEENHAPYGWKLAFPEKFDDVTKGYYPMFFTGPFDYPNVHGFHSEATTIRTMLGLEDMSDEDFYKKLREFFNNDE